MQNELGWDAVNYYDDGRAGGAALPASLRVPEDSDPSVLAQNQRGHCLVYPEVLVIHTTELFSRSAVCYSSRPAGVGEISEPGSLRVCDGWIAGAVEQNPAARGEPDGGVCDGFFGARGEGRWTGGRLEDEAAEGVAPGAGAFRADGADPEIHQAADGGAFRW